jgi:hypothetical protein
VKLTAEEWAERAEGMAAAFAKMEELDEKLKLKKAEHKAKYEVLQEKHKDLAKQVRTREEYRSVEVEIRADWTLGKIETYRMDTGECIRSREMTPQERQRDLSLVGLKN